MRPLLLVLVLSACASGGHSLPSAGAVPADDVTLVKGSLLPSIASVLSGEHIEAVTIGGAIFIRPESTGDCVLLQHERFHVKQWRENGPGFAIAYLFAVVLPGNKYEREAREHTSMVWRERCRP